LSFAVRLRPWHLTLLLAALCAGIVAGVMWWRTRPQLGVADQLRYLPPGEGPVLFVDLAVLRRAGVLAVLAGNKAAEEDDYRKFVQATGFDYREDLDTVLAGWRDDQLFILATGRFDWNRLSGYARDGHGRCNRAVCTVFATDPSKYISFTQLRTGVLGIAVSTDDMAAAGLGRSARAPSFTAPTDPVWAVVPGGLLVPRAGLPPALGAFLAALRGVNRATISLGGTVAQLELRLRGETANPKEAEEVTLRLRDNTELLKKMTAARPATQAEGITDVLAAGVFLTDENRVLARWPISRGLLEALAGGAVP
jgi:hypothetical protein